jgi:hypothetical protein
VALLALGLLPRLRRLNLDRNESAGRTVDSEQCPEVHQIPLE